jgi:hypothetical protein
MNHTDSWRGYDGLVVCERAAHEVPWHSQSNFLFSPQGMRIPIQLSEPKYLQTRARNAEKKSPQLV